MSGAPREAIDKATKTIWIGPCEGSEHNATCFVLHGFGDSSVGWYEIVREMSVRLPTVRFVIPTAPVSKIGVNSWFDFEKESPTNALDILSPLIEMETAICSNLAVIGFSQGGAVTLASLFGDFPIAAAVSMSAFFTKPPLKYLSSLSKTTTATPILITHGTLDDVVKFKSGKNSVSKLSSCGFTNVSFKSYDLPHSVSPDVINDVVGFLLQYLIHNNSDKSKL